MTDGPQAPRDEVIAAQVRAPIEVQLELDEDRWTLVLRRRFPRSPETLFHVRPHHPHDRLHRRIGRL